VCAIPQDNGRLLPYFPEFRLRPEDFANGKRTQHLGDVSDPATMNRHAPLFQSADLIFVDGSKDGRFEPLLGSWKNSACPESPCWCSTTSASEVCTLSDALFGG
jgi:hypothetical protein